MQLLPTVLAAAAPCPQVEDAVRHAVTALATLVQAEVQQEDLPLEVEGLSC